MSRKSELVILVGNLGSGKSTIAKEYAKEDYIIISRDGLRYMIGAGDYIFNPKYEKTIRALEITILEQFMNLNVNIVLDATNMSINTRKPILEVAKYYKYKKIAIILPKLNKQKSVNRRFNNPHGNFDRERWEKIYDNFNNNYEKPSKKEGFDKIIEL